MSSYDDRCRIALQGLAQRISDHYDLQTPWKVGHSFAAWSVKLRFADSSHLFIQALDGDELHAVHATSYGDMDDEEHGECSGDALAILRWFVLSE